MFSSNHCACHSFHRLLQFPHICKFENLTHVFGDLELSFAGSHLLFVKLCYYISLIFAVRSFKAITRPTDIWEKPSNQLTDGHRSSTQHQVVVAWNTSVMCAVGNNATGALKILYLSICRQRDVPTVWLSVYLWIWMDCIEKAGWIIIAHAFKPLRRSVSWDNETNAVNLCG